MDSPGLEMGQVEGASEAEEDATVAEDGRDEGGQISDLGAAVWGAEDGADRWVEVDEEYAHGEQGSDMDYSE